MRAIIFVVALVCSTGSLGCHVHVDGRTPSPRHEVPAASPVVAYHHPQGIYTDHWGLSEVDYRVLRHDLHLSDDDIAVTLFLASHSSWHWRRIGHQRRLGQGWLAITHRVGLTPLVYFVNIPRGASLRSPYRGIYDRYWLHRTRPQKIRLSDADCVSLVRLHLVRDRYGYDPLHYMGPGNHRSYQALLRDLENKRRAGVKTTSPPRKKTANKTADKRTKRGPREATLGKKLSADPKGTRATKPGVRRGPVAHVKEESPAKRVKRGPVVAQPVKKPSIHGAPVKDVTVKGREKPWPSKHAVKKTTPTKTLSHAKATAASQEKGPEKAVLAEKRVQRRRGPQDKEMSKTTRARKRVVKAESPTKGEAVTAHREGKSTGNPNPSTHRPTGKRSVAAKNGTKNNAVQEKKVASKQPPASGPKKTTAAHKGPDKKHTAAGLSPTNTTTPNGVTTTTSPDQGQGRPSVTKKGPNKTQRPATHASSPAATPTKPAGQTTVAADSSKTKGPTTASSQARNRGSKEEDVPLSEDEAIPTFADADAAELESDGENRRGMQGHGKGRR